MSDQPIYCVDTSSLLEAWVRSYRPKSFPSFWRLLEELIDNGRCVVCEEVRFEVDKDSHGLSEWLKSQANIVVPFDRHQELLVQKVMAEFPKLVNVKKNKGWADPFIIALALSKKFIVVTEESFGVAESPKIPFVWKEYGIECLSLIDLIERED